MLEGHFRRGDTVTAGVRDGQITFAKAVTAEPVSA
jgi:hypothetical protein